MSEAERLEILNRIERGEITPDEGMQLLLGLGSSPEAEEHAEQSPMEILNMIERGKISASEGIAKMSIAQVPEPEPASERVRIVSLDAGGGDEPPSMPNDAEMAKWRRWWMAPMYIGVAMVGLFGALMNSILVNSGNNFWFYCMWLPMGIGILLILLSLLSRGGKWIHVRVNDPGSKGKGGAKVAVSIPMFQGLINWALRNFGQFIPQLGKTGIDEIIRALDSLGGDSPLYVNVDDEDGTHVEVFIG